MHSSTKSRPDIEDRLLQAEIESMGFRNSPDYENVDSSELDRQLAENVKKFQRAVILNRRRTSIRTSKRQQLLQSFYMERLVAWESLYIDMIPRVYELCSEIMRKHKESTKAMEALSHLGEFNAGKSAGKFDSASHAFQSDGGPLLKSLKFRKNQKFSISTQPPTKRMRYDLSERNESNNFLSDMSKTDWMEKFRMSYDTFLWLCQHLAADMPADDECDQQKQIAIAIYLLANDSENEVVGHLFGVTSTYAKISLKSFIDCLLTKLGDHLLTLPKDAAEYAEIRQGFTRNSMLPPLVIGALGICQLPFIDTQSSSTGPVDKNIKLEIVVDERLLIRHLNVIGYAIPPVPKLPPEFTNMESVALKGQKLPQFLVGSSDFYRMTPWLMCPYRKVADRNSINFNQSCHDVLFSSKVCLQHLLGRWRILHRRLRFNFTTLERIIKACCILNNLCEELEQPFQDGWRRKWTLKSFTVRPQLNVAFNDDEDDGEMSQVRDYLAQSILEGGNQKRTD